MPPAIFLGDFADMNSFRGINPDAPPKEGLEASEGHIEGHEGRPSKRGASWSLWPNLPHAMCLTYRMQCA